MRITGNLIQLLEKNKLNEEVSLSKVKPEFFPNYIPQDVRNQEALDKYIAF